MHIYELWHEEIFILQRCRSVMQLAVFNHILYANFYICGNENILI